jgi:hypothetical protein
MLSGFMSFINAKEMVLFSIEGYENFKRFLIKGEDFWEAGAVIEGESRNLRGTG